MTQASAPVARPGLAALRSRAQARLAELGLPTSRLEEWRFTNPAPITRASWAAAPAGLPSAVAACATRPALGDWPRHEAILVAGRFHAEASGPAHGATLPAGVRIESLAAAAATDPASVDGALAAIAQADAPAAAFVTQNTAKFEDGVLVTVPGRTNLGAPVRIAHLPSAPGDPAGAGGPALVPGRVLVRVAAGAAITLIEDFRAFAASADFANTVTEIDLGEGASCTLVRLVGENRAGAHVASAWVRAGRRARFVARTFAIGGPLVRDDVHVLFAGEGGEASLDGLFVVSGHEHVDHHTTLDHAVPGCRSRELYKGVLSGSGRGVFNGAVVIRPDAQKSDSAQQNPNLLLSDDATIDTKPELQIHADDVKCAHGATVGQLDADAMFYLRARGIDPTAARALLVHAFAREVTDRIDHAGLRRDVDAWIEARMERLAREGA